MIRLIYILCIIYCFNCEPQLGPDPWNYDENDLGTKLKNDNDVPPDLRMYPKKKVETDSTLGTGEWFFRRMLGIVLKGGQVKVHEDGSKEVSLQMRLDEKQWSTLEEYMRSNTALSDEMFRRCVGFIEQAIYEPSISEKIVMAWSDHIQIYLTEYKDFITWTLAALGVLGTGLWLWTRMSHRHMIIVIFLSLYLYEVFVSYKEAEKQELDRFVSAMSSCKWQFWTSNCNVPTPDPLIFLKHMNPLKIGIRMFTTLISEPMITMSDTVKIMVHGITDGLWFPFDRIVYGILIISFNVLLLLIVIMTIFNYMLNIPFDLSFGLLKVGFRQRRRSLFTDKINNIQSVDNGDRISGATLDRLLDVFSQALTTKQQNIETRQHNNEMPSVQNKGMIRSASTGRLPNSIFSLNNTQAIKNSTNEIRKRSSQKPTDGSGDAH